MMCMLAVFTSLTALVGPPAIAAPAGVKPPPAITTEGVPPIPPELRRALNEYRGGAGFSFEGWLGGRREVLVRAGALPSGQVFSVVTPHAPPHQLTGIAGRVLGVVPRPGRNQFAMLYDRDGDEAVQVALFDTASGRATRLTDGRSRHTSPRWSPDGRLLAVTGDARNGRDYDLLLIDPEAPGDGPRTVLELRGLATVEDWSPDGSRVLVVNVEPQRGTLLRDVDVETGDSLTVLPSVSAPHVQSPSDPRWTPEGRAILAALYDGGEFRRLGRIDPEAGTVTILGGSIASDLESFDLADDGKTLAATFHDDGYSRLRILDAIDGRERARPTLPDGQIGMLQFRPGASEVGFTLETPLEASAVYSLIVKSGVVARWTLSTAPGASDGSGAVPERFRYRSFDGRSIPAFIHRPDPRRFPGPRPVLVDLHGGPQAQARPGPLGLDGYLVDALGMALVFPNVRGSTGYGLSYMRLDDREHREDAVRDVGALLDWIDEQPSLDAGRVAVRGGSYGGYLVLACLGRFEGRIAAGIDVAGISNFETFMADQPALRLELLRNEFGDERVPSDRSFLRAISPIRHAEEIQAPLLVVQGANDPRVPVAEARQIVEALRDQAIPAWYVLASNEGHGFSRGENRDFLRLVEARFLIEHLRRDAD